MMWLKIKRAGWCFTKHLVDGFREVTRFINNYILMNKFSYSLYRYAADREDYLDATIREAEGTYVVRLHDSHVNSEDLDDVYNGVVESAKQTASQWRSQEELLQDAKLGPAVNPEIRSRTREENIKISRNQRGEILLKGNHTATTNNNVIKLSSFNKEKESGK